MCTQMNQVRKRGLQTDANVRRDARKNVRRYARKNVRQNVRKYAKSVRQNVRRDCCRMLPVSSIFANSCDEEEEMRLT